MSRISIVEARIEDLDDLQYIVNDAQKLKLSKGDLAWGNKPYTKKQIRMDIERGNTFMVKVDGKNVGCVDLMWDDEYNWGKSLGLDSQAGYLHSLAVVRDSRGHGLGKIIADWVAEQVAAKGRKFVRLECHADNLELCSYYEKQGFKRVTPKSLPEKSAYYQKAV